VEGRREILEHSGARRPLQFLSLRSAAGVCILGGRENSVMEDAVFAPVVEFPILVVLWRAPREIVVEFPIVVVLWRAPREIVVEFPIVVVLWRAPREIVVEFPIVVMLWKTGGKFLSTAER
jgi:hypothetical protein